MQNATSRRLCFVAMVLCGVGFSGAVRAQEAAASKGTLVEVGPQGTHRCCYVVSRIQTVYGPTEIGKEPEVAVEILSDRVFLARNAELLLDIDGQVFTGGGGDSEVPDPFKAVFYISVRDFDRIANGAPLALKYGYGESAPKMRAGKLDKRMRDNPGKWRLKVEN